MTNDTSGDRVQNTGKVGYIGLGAMGGALARRLGLSIQLQVYDLNEKLVFELVEAGATAAESPAALARACDIIFICVPRSANVRQVIFGENGLLEGLTADKIVIDQTSGDPSETRGMAEELEQRGIHMLDAPVSGGATGAKAGTIAIMVGGAIDVLDRARPVLECISPNIMHCGAVGSGHVVKLINNTISTCNRLAMLEGVAMGVKNGIDTAVLRTVLNAGGARSRATENYLPVLLQGALRSDFALSLMLKDLNLSVELAMQSEVPLLFGQLARGMLQAAANSLGTNARIDDLADMVASQAAISGYLSFAEKN